MEQAEHGVAGALGERANFVRRAPLDVMKKNRFALHRP